MDFSQVDPIDGLNESEAILLAQMHLGDSKFRHTRDIEKPTVLSGSEIADYPDYWFVTFPPKYWTVKKRSHYLVVIHKTTAEVKYGGVWSPQEIEQRGFGWIFE